MDAPQPDQPARPDLGGLYGEARRRIADLVRDADPDTPVPATPEWTVHDVVAHLVGVVEDGLAGNFEGAPGPTWTGAQVARGRDRSIAELLAHWDDVGAQMEAALTAAGGAFAAAVFDVHSHEADLRGALGAPPSLPDAYAEFMIGALGPGVVARVEAAELPAVRVTTAEGDEFGDRSAPVTLATTRHEFHRTTFGRRSPDQIAAMLSGCADPVAYVGAVVIFGPRPDVLVD